MIFQKGYNDKPTKLKIDISDHHAKNRLAEVWIEQEGLPNFLPDGKSLSYPKETLGFISLEELLDLKGEINEAIRRITEI